MVRYPTTDKVAIENEGDIELNTGTVASAKVLTTADIFVDGSTEGLLAQLTSVTSRLAAAEAKLAGLVTCPPPGGVLSYDGTDFQCTCHGGYSGATCERPPSLTGCDGFYDVTTSKIQGAQAISGDSGNTAADPENDDIAALTDESRETYWTVKSSDKTKVFLVFDMQAPSNVVAIAFRGVPTYDSVYQAIYFRIIFIVSVGLLLDRRNSSSNLAQVRMGPGPSSIKGKVDYNLGYQSLYQSRRDISVFPTLRPMLMVM